jgi:hypothetical protein
MGSGYVITHTLMTSLEASLFLLLLVVLVVLQPLPAGPASTITPANRRCRSVLLH